MSNKSRILFISSSSKLGGGTKLMFMLGEKLNTRFEVFYAIPHNQIFSKFLNSKNHIKISERKINLKDILKLRKFIKINSIDLVHAHGKGAGLLARISTLFNKKILVYTFHGIHLKCHNLFIRVCYVAYEFLTGRLDSCKIFVSKSEKIYAKKSNIYIGNSSKIINNGVQNKKIKYHQKFINKKNKLLHKSKINVITICRLVEQKNLEAIFEIAGKLPDIHFSIIGYGPLFYKFKNFVSRKRIKNIDILGLKENVYDYLYEADIYLSTSLYEGLPISILEAMSVGIPIIASNVIGNSDTIINGKEGFLYDLKDIDSAVICLKKFRNENLRSKMGKLAHFRQRKKFSTAKMVKDHIILYKNLLG